MLHDLQVEHLEQIPLLSLDAELYKVEYRQMQLFSDVATSTGLMGKLILQCHIVSRLLTTGHAPFSGGEFPNDVCREEEYPVTDVSLQSDHLAFLFRIIKY